MASNIERDPTDAIFLVKQLQVKYLAKNKLLFLNFFGLEKVFDSIKLGNLVVTDKTVSCSFYCSFSLPFLLTSFTSISSHANPLQQPAIPPSITHSLVPHPLA